MILFIYFHLKTRTVFCKGHVAVYVLHLNVAVSTNESPPPLQGRQKLARFNAREFATLIIDILSDAKRRQQGKGLTSPAGERSLILFL